MMNRVQLAEKSRSAASIKKKIMISQRIKKSLKVSEDNNNPVYKLTFCVDCADAKVMVGK